jgi:hypothetical protein
MNSGGMTLVSGTLHLTQGNVSYDANMEFLETLAQTVQMHRQVVSSPRDSRTSVNSESKTLELACERFQAITSEAAPLFPSDISKVLHQYR